MVAKTLAIREAARYVKHHNVQRVIIELDSKTAILEINKGKDLTFWEVIVIVGEIQSIKEDMSSSETHFSYIKREQNEVANWLSKNIFSFG